MTEYFLPTGYGTAEHVEKKSRFIGQVWPVRTEAEAREKIEAVKKQYHDARHNCWCYLLRDGTLRYSDDGEPQGTAGQPMLEVFTREGITDAVCVVTRYFGGILLGTGGLARAYTKGAKDALSAAGISVERLWDRLLVACSYSLFERIRQETEKSFGVIEDTDFGADVTLTVLIPEMETENYVNQLVELSSGTVQGEKLDQMFRGVPVKSEE
ncbi:MAG: YigZ family protein [Oscillospiraceae bacterium]|nr:YigZ family protein [Oscillospiraceae bacterium]